MKEIKLYICDKTRAILDGACDGFSCLDCELGCNHTANSEYAKYDQTKSHNKWETIVLHDIETDAPVVTKWEIDPEEEHYDETLS